MKKVLAVIFALLFAFNIFLCVKSLTDSGKGQDALADAVVIKDGVVDEANEGRIVVVTGPIRVSAEAYDDITELTLESALAAKHTETVRYDYIDKDTNKKVTSPDFGLSTLDFDKKYRVEEHWTPEPEEYIYGAAWIGDFYLTGDMLIPLLNSEKLGVETFWQDELDDSEYWYYFEGDDIYFSYEDPDYFKEGDQRISYRGATIKEDTDYTIIGIQQGKYLYPPSDMGIAISIYEGKKSLSELSEGESKTGAMAAVFYIVLAVVFLGLALWLFGVFEMIFSKK
jgi:hypothetical protein